VRVFFLCFCFCFRSPDRLFVLFCLIASSFPFSPVCCCVCYGIGDNVEGDIRGANRAGPPWKSMWVKTGQTLSLLFLSSSVDSLLIPLACFFCLARSLHFVFSSDSLRFRFGRSFCLAGLPADAAALRRDPPSFIHDTLQTAVEHLVSEHRALHPPHRCHA